MNILKSGQKVLLAASITGVTACVLLFIFKMIAGEYFTAICFLFAGLYCVGNAVNLIKGNDK